MLTADLVRAYRRKGTLTITGWRGDSRARALTLATSYVAIAADGVDDTREALMDALADIPVGAREQKLAAGLRKLVLDRCEFESDAAHDPAALREKLFTMAAEARREGAFDRDALMARLAEEIGQPPEETERLLYADLKGAQRMLAFEAIEPAALVDRYDEAQVQAVLLKAERVVAEVRCAHPGTYRALFRKLKFLRLLHRIEADGDRYRIELDGPLSLFRSNTKYGLSLALALPSIRACDEWSIDAIVRWGKDRSKLAFRAEGEGRSEPMEAPLPDEVAQLVERMEKRFEKGKGEWRAKPCTELLSVEGLGVCAPDLVLESRNGEQVYLEVMGFWSRDAVFKRIELVESGLGAPIVFAVPKRLRVSEELLPEELPGALYVYKGVMSPTRVEECAAATLG